ncbi:MAG: NAD-dependent succinate-semialdehyde dehydrogenase [Burkholderiaceae bacterium]
MATVLKDPSLLRSDGLIAGAWRAAVSGRRFSVSDPASGEAIAQVANMGAQEAREAVDAAAAALPAWRARSTKERVAVLRAWHGLILAHADDLAMLMTREQGKPLAEARGEVLYAASFVEWFAEEARRAYGEIIPSPSVDRELLVFREAIGVAAAITPWNFPAAMITRKCAPALVVGCSVVVKPAEATPLTALALAELGQRAGFPAGIFNVVVGDADAAPAIGEVLCEDPRVRKLSFTGSTEVGRLLYKQCAPTVKKLSLELGGNAPFIVFDDADLDAAVDGLMAAKFRNAGQTCVCPNRIYVQSGAVAAFSEKLVARVATLRVGPGLGEGVQIGPLIEEAAVEKVEAHLADAVAHGARVLCGGARHQLGGLFFEPTVLVGATAQMRIAREETFGPVAPIFPFESEAEVIEAANATEFGLAAYFYARDVGRVFRVAHALEAGMVSVNAGAFSNEVAPFGGVKQSGLGREGARHGLDEYLETKYVTVAGLR